MKFNKKLVLTALLSIFLLSGCGSKSAKDAAITINDKVITKQEIQKEYDKVLDNIRFIGRKTNEQKNGRIKAVFGENEPLQSRGYAALLGYAYRYAKGWI